MPTWPSSAPKLLRGCPMSDEKVLICALVSMVDEPVLGSVVGRCGMCSEEIWVSPEMVELRKATLDSILRCLECATGEFGDDEAHVQALPGSPAAAHALARAVHQAMREARPLRNPTQERRFDEPDQR